MISKQKIRARSVAAANEALTYDREIAWGLSASGIFFVDVEQGAADVLHL